MRNLPAALGAAMIIGGTLAFAPAGSVERAADDSSAHAADTARDQAVEAHIKALHKELGITSSEESQWDRVAQTMRDNAQRLDKVIDARKASMGTHETAVDDLNNYAQIAQTHAENVKRMADAFSNLYSAMSDEQKREADQVFNHRAREARSARNSRSGETSTTQQP